MEIETQNAVGLFFPNPSFLQIYFESVANALDAEATEIKIDIEIQAFLKPDSLKVAVTDNGTGFTDESFARFRRLLKPPDAFSQRCRASDFS